jgi:hypothetical protein
MVMVCISIGFAYAPIQAFAQKQDTTNLDALVVTATKLKIETPLVMPARALREKVFCLKTFPLNDRILVRM